MSKKTKKLQKKFWPLIIFVITLILSASFSAVAFALHDTNIFISLSLLIILLLVSMIFDLIGVAFAACDKTPFIAMCSKKIRGAKISLKLLQSADKVATICNDVVGDVTGIVSGALGTAILISFALSSSTFNDFVLPIIVSSMIASATVFGKSFSKSLALKHSVPIVTFVGKLLSLICKNG